VRIKNLVRSRVFPIAALSVMVAACADNTSPTGLSAYNLGARGDVAGAASRPTRFSNRIKYRDKGLQPARGRSGNATLTARALLGANGMTSLDVSTGEINAPSSAFFKKIQVKLFASTGSVQSTTNYNVGTSPNYQLTIPGRARGSSIGVQANIIGVDGSRTDVVTVTETVKLRPDLRVDRITNPEHAQIGIPVGISALVSERNGDVGANADCVLSADGVEVDRAHGIWIDANGSVSCMFRPIFSTVGQKHLTVSLVSVDPADYDVSNNSASATIDIITPASLNQFNWRAEYNGVHYHASTLSVVSNTTEPLNNHDDVSFFQNVHHEDAATTIVYAELPEYLGRPLNFSLSTAMDGQSLVQVALDPVNDFLFDTDFSYSDPQYGIVTLHIECRSADRTTPIVVEGQVSYASLAQAIVCTQGADGDNIPPGTIRTQVSFITNAGDVSYYSEHYATYTYGDGSGGYTYSFVGETNYTYGTLLFGNEWSFRTEITGPLGTRVATGSVAISSEEVFLDQPYACFDNNGEGWTQHYCTQYSLHYVRMTGQADGVAAGP
jgi:hypothetical protein